MSTACIKNSGIIRMDELKQFVELCDAKSRAIENYAKQLNILKDKYDQLIKPERNHWKRIIDEIIEEAILEERERCAVLVEKFEPEYFYLGQVKRAANLIRTRCEK